jgi:hypothetical protein
MIKGNVLILSVALLAGCGDDTPNSEVVKHVKEMCKKAGGQYFTGYSENPLGLWYIEVGCVYPKQEEIK